MQDFSKLTWSSWWRHLNPGIDLANVQTCKKKVINIPCYSDRCLFSSHLTNMIHKALWECIKERLFGTTLHWTGLKIINNINRDVTNKCMWHVSWVSIIVHPNIGYQRLLLIIWGWWPSLLCPVTDSWPIPGQVSLSHWLRLGRGELSSWRRPPVAP